MKNYRQIVYVCCLTSFVTITFAFGRYIFSVLTPDIAKDLNLNYEFIGKINALHQFLYFLFSLIGGLISTVIGARLLISSSVMLCSLSIFSLYFVHDKWVLLLIVALQGLFAATSWVPVVQIVSTSIAEENRGKTFGIVSSGTSYGLILNSVLIPFILTSYNWQTVWLIYGAISFVIGLFGVYIVYSTNNLTMPSPYGSGQATDGKMPYDSSAAVENRIKGINVQNVLFILLLILSGAYLVPFLSYIVPFMQDDLGLNHKIAGAGWGIFGILGMFSGFIAGVLADRLSAKKAMLITYGISFAAIVVLIAFHNAFFVLSACALFGLAYYGIYGLHPAYVSKMFSPEKTAKVFGFFNLALGVGSMAGNYVFGYIKNAFGSFTNAYISMAILSFISLGICFFIKGDG